MPGGIQTREGDLDVAVAVLFERIHEASLRLGEDGDAVAQDGGPSRKLVRLLTEVREHRAEAAVQADAEDAIEALAVDDALDDHARADDTPVDVVRRCELLEPASAHGHIELGSTRHDLAEVATRHLEMLDDRVTTRIPTPVLRENLVLERHVGELQMTPGCAHGSRETCRLRKPVPARLVVLSTHDENSFCMFGPQ